MQTGRIIYFTTETINNLKKLQSLSFFFFFKPLSLLSLQNGLNALHLASKEGHVEVVAELIKQGANVDAATKVCATQESHRHTACT